MNSSAQISDDEVSVVIVCHSVRGHVAKLAGRASEGACEVPGTRCDIVLLDHIDADSWGMIEGAHALIFGSPTYMGGVSSTFKKFAEETLAAWADNQRWKDKVAAGFTHSQAMSGDKLHTLQYFSILAAQHGMVWVNLDLMPGWCTSSGNVEDPNRLGGWLGAMSQSDGDASLDDNPREGDLRTVHHLGRRVASITRALVVGRKSLRND